MSAYFVARIAIHDPVTYARYLDGTDEPLARYGGEVLAVDDEPEVLEGAWPAGRVVVIRFPDREALRSWYESPEYSAVSPLRWRSAVTEAAVVRGKA